MDLKDAKLNDFVIKTIKKSKLIVYIEGVLTGILFMSIACLVQTLIEV